jgi:hypothetical protein
MRTRTFVTAVLVACLAAVGAGGSAGAAKKIKPKGGGYVGKVTGGNGRGPLRLAVAKLSPGSKLKPNPRGKPKKGLQLSQWIALLRCNDGSTLEFGPSVVAPLKGAGFDGKSSTSARTVTLTGRFTTNTTLVGTARVVTSGQSPHTQCDSGPVTFKASHR